MAMPTTTQNVIPFIETIYYNFTTRTHPSLQLEVGDENVEHIDYTNKFFYYDGAIMKGEEFYKIIRDSGRLRQRYSQMRCDELSYYDWKYIIEDIIEDLPGYITTNYWNSYEEAEQAVAQYKQDIMQYKKDMKEVEDIREQKLSELRRNENISPEERQQVIHTVEELSMKYDYIKNEIANIDCI
jgi:alpha-galactosidase/6-phospho-beta-glucosidase family protein